MAPHSNSTAQLPRHYKWHLQYPSILHVISLKALTVYKMIPPGWSIYQFTKTLETAPTGLFYTINQSKVGSSSSLQPDTSAASSYLKTKKLVVAHLWNWEQTWVQTSQSNSPCMYESLRPGDKQQKEAHWLDTVKNGRHKVTVLDYAQAKISSWAGALWEALTHPSGTAETSQVQHFVGATTKASEAAHCFCTALCLILPHVPSPLSTQGKKNLPLNWSRWKVSQLDRKSATWQSGLKHSVCIFWLAIINA